MRFLTDDARKDREEFEVRYAGEGCICFLGHPPCSFCTHPGNPANQEDDSCYDTTPDAPPLVMTDAELEGIFRIELTDQLS